MEKNFVEEAEFYIDRKRYDDAKKSLLNYFQYELDDYYAFSLLTICELKLNNLVAAQDAVDECLRLYPNYAYGHYLQALVFLREEKLEDAEDVLITGAVLMSLMLLAFPFVHIPGLIIIALLELIVFGVLFSFRWIGY